MSMFEFKWSSELWIHHLCPDYEDYFSNLESLSLFFSFDVWNFYMAVKDFRLNGSSKGIVYNHF